MPIDVEQEVLDAEQRIRPHVVETPLEYSAYLSHLADCEIYLKLENVQVTGSFKYRGAVNRVLSLTEEDRQRGIITSSSGNHGAAFTFASRKLGCQGTLVLPENVSPCKLEYIQLYGATDILYHGTDVGDTEAFAKRTAEERGSLFISPYNDPKIIGGQGTVGLEILRQQDGVDAIFVPVGGGGLASGISGYVKSVKPEIEIIGCQPENSPVMYESVKAGKIIEMESLPTLADGTAGGIEPGSVTFDICQKNVDEYVLVSEDELAKALILSLEKHNMLIEGAAALSIASFLKIRRRFKGKCAVLVLSGKKITLDTLKKIICKGA